MNWAAGIIVYVISWWLIFFMVLPWGVQSQAESNDVEEGTEPGAPVKPQLLKKMAVTTVIAFGVLFVVDIIVDNGLLDDLFTRQGGNVWSGE